MGWFIIAAVFGFLSFWTWRSAPKDEPRRPSERIISFVNTYLGQELPLTVVFVIVTALGVWLMLYLFDKDYKLYRFVDSLGHGTTARLLLGFALGFGFAFLQEQRFKTASPPRRAGDPKVGTPPASAIPASTTVVHSAAADTATVEAATAAAAAVGTAHPPAVDTASAGTTPSPQGPDRKTNGAAVDANGTSNILMQAGKNTVLVVALAIVFIALAAPHVDHWLSHLTTVKLPFAELQVTSIGAHRGIMADQISFYSDIRSIEYLGEYRTKLHYDLSYIETFELPEKQQEIFVDEKAVERLQNSIRKMNALSFSFDYLISPIATCAKAAIDNGMSRDMVRQMVMPLGHTLDQIILMENSLTESELQSKHREFWERLMRIPGEVQLFLKQPQKEECLLIPQAYSYGAVGIGIDAFPKIQDYKDISYLYTAALLLTSFLKEEQISLKILDRIQKELKLEIQDYFFLIWASNITINQGTRIDLVIPYLNQMRQTAQTRREAIQRFQDHCEPVYKELFSPAGRCGEELLGLAQRLGRREREVELRAKNNFAYYVAEALARGEKAAEAYAGQAEEYAVELFSAVEGHPGQRSNMGLQFDLGAKYDYLDTYAYLLMVLEARKAVPDVNKFREFVAIFEKAVEQAETEERDSRSLEPRNLYGRMITRTHLATAKELAGQ
jgi:hypothetical protein